MKYTPMARYNTFVLLIVITRVICQVTQDFSGYNCTYSGDTIFLECEENQRVSFDIHIGHAKAYNKSFPCQVREEDCIKDIQSVGLFSTLAKSVSDCLWEPNIHNCDLESNANEQMICTSVSYTDMHYKFVTDAACINESSIIDICGSDIAVSDEEGWIITSGHPGSYPSDSQCSKEWDLQENQQIHFQSDYMDMGAGNNQECQDKMTISHRGDEYEFCDTQLQGDIPTINHTFIGLNIKITFSSKQSASHHGTRIYFRVSAISLASSSLSPTLSSPTMSDGDITRSSELPCTTSQPKQDPTIIILAVYSAIVTCVMLVLLGLLVCMYKSYMKRI